MEISLELIVFTILALFTVVSAVLAVTTRRILRAATYLLFVLFGTAGIYFQLNYSFLGAVQMLIYAGGITVLYVFSILLTSSEGDKAEDIRGYKLFAGLAATFLSLGVCLYVTLRHDFQPLALRTRRAGGHRHRTYAHESRQVWLPAPLRGHKHPAAGLHRGRNTHREKTLVKKHEPL